MGSKGSYSICRLTNFFFAPAPSTSLARVESLCGLQFYFPAEMEDRTRQSPMGSFQIYVGVSAVDNWVHRMRMPARLSYYFALETKFSAQELHAVGDLLDGHVLQRNERVHVASFFQWALRGVCSLRSVVRNITSLEHLRWMGALYSMTTQVHWLSTQVSLWLFLTGYMLTIWDLSVLASVC